MRTPFAVAALVALAVAPGAAYAASDNAGTTAANFLTIGTGPSVLGMGGATLGLAGDLASVAWNPGSLAWLHDGELALAHANVTQDVAQEWASAGGRFGASNTRWSLSGVYQSEGSFSSRDAANNDLGSFDVASMAFGAHLAHAFGGSVGVGVGAKWVNEILGDVRGAGVTFDAGLQVRSGMLGIGLAAQNAFGKMRYSGSVYDFPTTYGVGVALDHARSGMRAAIDVNVPNAYYTNMRAGLEWRWRELAALRAGYRAELGAPQGEALSGPTFGLGAGVYGLWLDYGFLITEDREGQHRLGVTLHPGRMGWKPGDPFGQGGMRTEFEDAKSATKPAKAQVVGPPAPKR